MNDDEIMSLFMNRDEKALSEAKDRYGAKCYSIAFGILKNRQDAEETVSDALLAVWQNIPPDQPPVFCAYLFKVVRNKALCRLRDENREKRRAESVPFDEIDEYIPDRFDTDEAIQTKELSALLNGFLSQLKESDRRIFICRYFAEMPVKDIAKKYGIGQSKTKMILMRTREKLREYLKKVGYAYE
ncbi:MAG: sigma-70 family RNA polymerase sigma factor [Clostridia bacterium]|nr:sigma-70 family RNA polymerase sigma factor [Clostridia bacterium]